MSLKAFHIVFMAASILLAIVFGGWTFAQYRIGGGPLMLAAAGACLAAAIGMLIYARWFLRKLRNVSYL